MTQRIAILFSGRGSNMDALARHIAQTHNDTEIALTLTDNPHADGIARAQDLRLPCEVIERKAFATRIDFEAALRTALDAAHIDFICAAGFMRVLSAEFVTHWRGRILNIHPSLLPKYRGLDTHRRVLESGDKTHGCTVHYMTPEVDKGEILAQESIIVHKNDTADSLAARVLEKEHSLYPRALDMALERLNSNQPTSSESSKKKAISTAAVSGASEPCTEFASMLSAKS